MGCGEMEDLELASMDLYTRVKLRASKGKRQCRGTCSSILDNVELTTGRYSESRGIELKNESESKISDTTTVKNENQSCDRAISVNCDGLMLLLEVMKGELDGRVLEKGEKVVNVEDLVYSNLSDEGTAVEMLGALSEERSKTLSRRFNFGELVWGKIKSHPWWPGQIYDEALATSSVYSTKDEGCVLVAFFGDNTYGWLNPKNIVPFEHHFSEKSKQSNAELFLEAVEEAVEEVKKRSVLGLTCKCRCNGCTFKPAKVQGYYEVNVEGYETKSVCAVEQIEKERSDFQPNEMLSFLQNLALRPKIGLQENVNWISNLSRVLAYREAVSEKPDKTFTRSFGKSALYNGKKRPPEASFPAEESKALNPHHQFFNPLKNEDDAKQIYLGSNNLRENACQNISLQETSMPEFPIIDSDDPVQVDKRRIVFCQEETIVKRQRNTRKTGGRHCSAAVHSMIR